VKERPILFSGPMVRAILAGTKTQTRRVVRVDEIPITEDAARDGRLQKGIPSNAANVRLLGDYVKCDAPPGSHTVSSRVLSPYGLPGDRLWVRERYQLPDGLDKHNAGKVESMAKEAGYRRGWSPIRYHSDGEERLRELMSDAPGCFGPTWGRARPSIHMPRWASRITLEVTAVRVERLQDISEEDARAEGLALEPLIQPGHAVGCFSRLWDEINGKRAPWSSNPWVWAISFRRVEHGHGR
jgi:hypothetical protein